MMARPDPWAIETLEQWRSDVLRLLKELTERLAGMIQSGCTMEPPLKTVTYFLSLTTMMNHIDRERERLEQLPRRANTDDIDADALSAALGNRKLADAIVADASEGKGVSRG